MQRYFVAFTIFSIFLTCTFADKCPSNNFLDEGVCVECASLQKDEPFYCKPSEDTELADFTKTPCPPSDGFYRPDGDPFKCQPCNLPETNYLRPPAASFCEYCPAMSVPGRNPITHVNDMCLDCSTVFVSTAERACAMDKDAHGNDYTKIVTCERSGHYRDQKGLCQVCKLEAPEQRSPDVSVCGYCPVQSFLRSVTGQDPECADCGELRYEPDVEGFCDTREDKLSKLTYTVLTDCPSKTHFRPPDGEGDGSDPYHCAECVRGLPDQRAPPLATSCQYCELDQYLTSGQRCRRCNALAESELIYCKRIHDDFDEALNVEAPCGRGYYRSDPFSCEACPVGHTCAGGGAAPIKLRKPLPRTAVIGIAAGAGVLVVVAAVVVVVVVVRRRRKRLDYPPLLEEEERTHRPGTGNIY